MPRGPRRSALRRSVPSSSSSSSSSSRAQQRGCASVSISRRRRKRICEPRPNRHDSPTRGSPVPDVAAADVRRSHEDQPDARTVAETALVPSAGKDGAVEFSAAGELSEGVLTRAWTSRGAVSRDTAPMPTGRAGALGSVPAVVGRYRDGCALDRRVPSLVSHAVGDSVDAARTAVSGVALGAQRERAIVGAERRVLDVCFLVVRRVADSDRHERHRRAAIAVVRRVDRRRDLDELVIGRREHVR